AGRAAHSFPTRRSSDLGANSPGRGGGPGHDAPLARGLMGAADPGPLPDASGGRTVARIVEVGSKDVTDREAVAECTIAMTPDACASLVAGTPKGDPIEAARVAGIMAVKRTPDLLPFCHPVAVTG